MKKDKECPHGSVFPKMHVDTTFDENTWFSDLFGLWNWQGKGSWPCPFCWLWWGWSKIMQMNPLAPCRKNTCSVLAAVAVLFVAMVLRNELEKKKKKRSRKSVNKYLNACPGKGTWCMLLLWKLLEVLALIFRSWVGSWWEQANVASYGVYHNFSAKGKSLKNILQKYFKSVD